MRFTQALGFAVFDNFDFTIPTLADSLFSMETNQLLALSPSQLRHAAEIKEQIDRLNDELGHILDGKETTSSAKTSAGAGGRRKMSAAARARIGAAAKARWARFRAAKSGSKTDLTTANDAVKPKRTMSAAAKKKIAAAATARWAKIRAAKA